ncbi:hypothetical protein BBJ28_00006835 [Nothophytophthora sp. Chile5]|nr:hypothetical protein BBJ28_00006835 [Nothophytophthora sp. Chile5]
MNLEAALPKQRAPPSATRRTGSSWRFVVAAAVAAVLVVSQLATYKPHFDAHLAKHRILRNLQERPALRLNFQLKRKAMYVHGASTFDVLATPSLSQSSVDNAMVYNGLATFQQDGETHEYSLVDGTAYYTNHPVGRNASKSGCLPSGFVPPIETVLDAIDSASTATHLVGAEMAAAACPGGSLLAFSFADENYLLCSRRTHEEGFRIIGEDLDIEVHYEQSAPVIVAPIIPSDVALSCGKVPSNKAISPLTTSLFTRSFSEWGHRSLRSEEADSWISSLVSKVVAAVTDDDDSASSSSSCSTTARPCVFVAGLGQSTDSGLSSTDDKPYFGDEILDNAPCCSSIQYIELATNDYAWYDTIIVQRMTDLIFEVSTSSDATTGVIADTIIFTHSSANNMLAYAIATGLCSLDATTTWLGASAPMIGSMASDFIQEACDGTLTGVVSSLLELLDECPATTGRVALSYQTGDYASSELIAAYTTAQPAYAANIDAVMCSSSYTGLSSSYEAVYILAGEMVGHKSSENDGLVEYDSCAYGLDTSTFSSSYSSTNYLTKLNHQDCTFRNGDGLFSDAKKPLKWLKNLLS